MSFIRHKIIKGKKFAYEITAYRDKETKKPRQKIRYLGVVDEAGVVAEKTKNKEKNESLLLDFGNGYLLHEFYKQSNLSSILEKEFQDLHSELTVLIFYRLCMQSAMYNCDLWLEGNIVRKLYPKANLASQHISKVLSALGEENFQRRFFTQYLKEVGGSEKSVIIDATSLPNEISSGFNAWGPSDGAIEKQFRFLCVVDQHSKLPLFYRYLPGNLTEVSSLQKTIAELSKLGVKNNFVLIDAGYLHSAPILKEF
jgi:hypothetical protein